MTEIRNNIRTETTAQKQHENVVFDINDAIWKYE